MEQFLLCLKQKVILLTKIFNITKQIEVRSTQPEIELDDFLEQRGIFINRLNKCNNLIKSIINQMPKDKKDRTTEILELKIPESGCNEEEIKILKLSKNCSDLLKRTASLDSEARKRIQKQRNEYMEKINELRKKEKNNNLYHNIK